MSNLIKISGSEEADQETACESITKDKARLRAATKTIRRRFVNASSPPHLLQPFLLFLFCEPRRSPRLKMNRFDGCAPQHAASSAREIEGIKLGYE